LVRRPSRLCRAVVTAVESGRLAIEVYKGAGER
jgi:hypothetical protein